MAAATEKKNNVLKVKIDQLVQDNINANKGTEYGQHLIENSLRKFGAGRSILLDKNNRIIAGNKTIENAAAIGLDNVIVVETTGKQIVAVKRTDIDLDSADGREMAIADNASAKANIEWDPENIKMITQEWKVDVESWGIELPELTPAVEGKEDDYEIPDEIKTDIVLGDLFEIGEHRLLCGDSTNSDDVQKLLQAKEPYLMVTDPPYGVTYDPNWRASQVDKGFGSKIKGVGKVMNDDRADWSETWSLSPSKVAYIWHGGKHAAIVSDSLIKCDFDIRSQIIWAKPSLTFSRGDYHWQHEPCWYAVKKGSKGNWAGDRKQTTLWEIHGLNPAGRSTNKNDENVGHGTQKPVECMARPIKNHDGDVYDPFLGSGITMVASHQLNRKCYGMELDPKYCQVIIDRMRKLDPTLTIKRNGEVMKFDN